MHQRSRREEGGPVPRFLRSQWTWPGARDRLTLGLWTAGEAALLGRPAELPDNQEEFELVVRAFGSKRVAEQLIACIEDWRRAGSPVRSQIRRRCAGAVNTAYARDVAQWYDFYLYAVPPTVS